MPRLLSRISLRMLLAATCCSQALSGDAVFAQPDFDAIRAEEIRKFNQYHPQLVDLRKRQLDTFALSLADTGVPAAELFVVLSRLEREETRSEALVEFVERDWHRRSSESVEDWIARSERELAEVDQTTLSKFRGQVADFELLSGQRWTWPWTARREHWLGFVQTVEAAGTAENPANPFRSRAKADPQHMPFYVEAYLAWIDARDAEQADFELIREYLHAPELSPGESFRRQALAVASLAGTALPADHVERSRFEKALVDRVAAGPLDPRQLDAARLEIQRLLEGLPRERRHELVRTVFEKWSHVRAFPFAVAGGMSDDEIRETFLAKSMRVDVEGRPFSEVVQYLEQSVELPLWIDESVADDGRAVTVEAEGTWWDVARRVVATAGHEIVLVDDAVFWIGPMERREAAETRLRAAAARAVQLPDLAERSSATFRHVPTDEALEFLGDWHDIEIIRPFPIDSSVMLYRQAAPLYLLLEIIADRADLEWTTFERTIVVAPRERFGEVREAIDRHRERMVMLRRLELDGRLPQGLRHATEAHFQDVPLSEAIEFLADLHDTNIVLLSPERDAEPVNRILSGVSLPTLLVLMLIEHGLEWDTDGEVVVVGTPEDVAVYRELVESRERRRGERKALSQPVSLDETSGTAAESIAALVKVAGTEIRLADGVAAPARLSLGFQQVPLDVALDTLAVRLDAEWRVEDGAVVLVPHRP